MTTDDTSREALIERVENLLMDERDKYPRVHNDAPSADLAEAVVDAVVMPLVQERDELQAENERLRGEINGLHQQYVDAVDRRVEAMSERDSERAEVERLWANLDESREYTKKALAERDAAIKRAEAAEQERDRLAAEKAKWQAEALREAAEGLHAGMRGSKCNPACHEADQITLRLRANRIEKGSDDDH